MLRFLPMGTAIINMFLMLDMSDMRGGGAHPFLNVFFYLFSPIVNRPVFPMALIKHIPDPGIVIMSV